MRTRKPPRPSYRWFMIRYSGWGGEYKATCIYDDYESSYGTRGKAIKSAAAHVVAKHGVADGFEIL